MSKQENDILIKTVPLGFDKKATMDYIEKIQLENEGLVRQVRDLSARTNELLKENAMLKARLQVTRAQEQPQEAPAPAPAPQKTTEREVENLADLDAPLTFEMPYERKKQPTIITSNKNTVTKKGGKTYVSSKNKN
ncbi:MAG: hypothetical protein Q4F70_03070 [Clostridia bacterium]|nr:hypothetical protein [Clostridia bacterium]